MSKRVYTIAAKPGDHAGVPMKSQLERNWSTFFDERNIPWEYESQVFRLPCRPLEPWRPDFRLRSLEKWAEVKPTAFEDEEYALCVELAIRSGYGVLLLVGDPGNGPFECLRWDKDRDECLSEEWRFERR